VVISANYTLNCSVLVGGSLTQDVNAHPDAIYTRSIFNASIMFADWVNNTKGGISVGGEKCGVRVKALDDDLNATRVAENIQQLINEDVKLLLGPFGSTLTKVASAIRCVRARLTVQCSLQGRTATPRVC
jgi:hypothetical protein